MKKLTMSVIAGVASTLLVAAPALAAAKPSTPAKPAAAKATAARSAWRPETISGTIAAVQPDKKLVVVKTSDGTPFDMVVTGKTRIMSGNQALTLKDLSQDRNKTVSVRFVPERGGDVARSIRING